MIQFTVNGEPIQSNLDPTTPILWVLRDDLALTGTKFGCGMALCPESLIRGRIPELKSTGE